MAGKKYWAVMYTYITGQRDINSYNTVFKNRASPPFY